MLTLYRTPDCPGGDAVQQRLRELTMAHKVVSLADPSAGAAGSAPAEPPVLCDDDRTYVGGDAILAHLERLAAIKTRWDQFGADACYCDDQGEVL